MLLTHAGTIRPCTPDDLPEVADLWNRVFRRCPHPASPAVHRSFHDIFFRSPWHDPDLPSLIYENRHGIAGFLGVMPRPMLFGDRPIRAAVATQLMVDARRQPGFAALELIRHFLSGPQDLSYSDGANESAQRIWQRSGGDICRFYSMEWTRLLRPAQFLHHRLSLSRNATRCAPFLAAALSPVDALLSRAMLRNSRHRAQRLRTMPLEAQDILANLPRLTDAQTLRPSYTLQSLQWLLQHCSESRTLGNLRKLLVRDPTGDVLGWFIYYAAPGHIAQVLHLTAAEATIAPVLDCLFDDAWRCGAIAISGQMDPRFLRELSDQWCLSSCPGIGVLVHARDPRLLLAIHRGDAALTRLEGEWWLRFGIDRAAGW